MGKQQGGEMVLMACTSKGPRNNGIVKRCTFQEMFPDTGYKYNCPTCSAPLKKKKFKKPRPKKKEFKLSPSSDGHI